MENSKLKENYNKFLLVWIAFVISLGVYIFVSEFVIFSKMEQITGKELLFYIFLAISISEIMVIRFIKQIILKGGISNQLSFEQKLNKLQISSIVSFAVAETPCLFGFVLAFLSHNRMYFYILVTISLIAFGLNFPNKTFWKEYLGSSYQENSITPE